MSKEITLIRPGEVLKLLPFVSRSAYMPIKISISNVARANP